MAILIFLHNGECRYRIWPPSSGQSRLGRGSAFFTFLRAPFQRGVLAKDASTGHPQLWMVQTSTFEAYSTRHSPFAIHSGAWISAGAAR